MASTASATFSPLATSFVNTRNSKKRSMNYNNVHYITGMNSFAGLRAQNNTVAALGLPMCTEQSFAKIVSSLRSFPTKGQKGGGALSSTCNAVDEIFRIAAIMNGLVLVGVAVGFVLLRIEAFVEEAES